MYAKFFKRVLDFVLSLCALIVLSPVLLILVVLMPYAALIPMPTIAAILFQVAYNMCQWRPFVHLVKTAPKSDVLVLVLTFALTVIFDLVVAIEVGLLLACLLFMKRMSDETDVRGWKYADKPENSHVKCFVRGGLDDVRFTPTHNPHCAGTPRMKCINPSGEEVHQGAFAPIDHKVMWIDHYFTKTAEEWMHVKLKRGYHGLPKHTAGIVAHQEERFFAVNERTPEKEQILRDGVQKVIDNFKNMVARR